MRRRIRLTGRQQLNKSDFNVRLPEVGGKRILTLTLANQNALARFPNDAEVSVRLFENKRVEVVKLGTVGNLKASHELLTKDFVAPSCRVRVAKINDSPKGLLFGSTDDWTLRGDGQESEENRKGILLFLPADTAPQSWKLEIRPNEHPIIKVDKRIPNAGLWARNDPVFASCALPAAVSAIFSKIFDSDEEPDIEWMSDWIKWAQALMPDTTMPFGGDDTEVSEYMDRLLDVFCSRHGFSEILLKSFDDKDDTR